MSRRRREILPGDYYKLSVLLRAALGEVNESSPLSVVYAPEKEIGEKNIKHRTPIWKSR